jgi:hypothetical protein
MREVSRTSIYRRPAPLLHEICPWLRMRLEKAQVFVEHFAAPTPHRPTTFCTKLGLYLSTGPLDTGVHVAQQTSIFAIVNVIFFFYLQKVVIVAACF